MDKKTIVPILLIILLSLLSYFNVFDNEFVWDDHVFILDNADIRSFSNLPLFFTEDVDGLYRPLRSLHYTFIYSIAGKNEFLYHLNGVFLHIIISILVFFILYEMIGKRNISLIAALIFAVHPIHTGRVTNITAGFDLLGIFFMLLSFYFYIKFSKNKNSSGNILKNRYFMLSIFIYLLAVFSSEEAIVLPLLIVLYEFCFNREQFNNKNTIMKNIFKNYFPFIGIGLFYIITRTVVMGFGGRIEEYLAGNFFLTMLTMLKVYIYYIYLLIVPVNLTLYHEIAPVISIIEFKVIFSALILISIIFLTIKHNKNKILFFSVFWFFITLIPFSNLLPLQVFMAERYLYVPSIAFSLLLSYLIFTIFNFRLKKIKIKKLINHIFFIFVILLLSFYIFSTVNRNNDWADNLTLWSVTVESNPNNSRAHDNLGFTYDHAGDIEKALIEFEKSVELKNDNYKALANLGVAYAKLKQYNKSIITLKNSIKIYNNYKTFDKLGLVYVELEEEEKAILQFKEAIKINPRYAKAHNDLGTVYGQIGEFDLALLELKEATRIDKDYADAHYNLGIMLEFLEQDDLARKEFEIAIRLEPENELYKKKS